MRLIPLLLLILTACASTPQTGFNVPPLPAWRPVAVSTLTGQQVAADVKKLAPAAAVDLVDTTYTVVSYDFDVHYAVEKMGKNLTPP